MGKVDIADILLPPSTSEKIRLMSGIALPGMISMHEEHSVRVQCGYKLYEWRELKPAERALEVATRRLESFPWGR